MLADFLVFIALADFLMFGVSRACDEGFGLELLCFAFAKGWSRARRLEVTEASHSRRFNRVSIGESGEASRSRGSSCDHDR